LKFGKHIQSFFFKTKKFKKRVSKYLFKGKNENLGLEKKYGGWEEKNSYFGLILKAQCDYFGND
jgi:hypothetical protein